MIVHLRRNLFSFANLFSVSLSLSLCRWDCATLCTNACRYYDDFLCVEARLHNLSFSNTIYFPFFVIIVVLPFSYIPTDVRYCVTWNTFVSLFFDYVDRKSRGAILNIDPIGFLFSVVFLPFPLINTLHCIKASLIAILYTPRSVRYTLHRPRMIIGTFAFRNEVCVWETKIEIMTVTFEPSHAMG